MLDQRRRRWADVVQMLYKCFVFAGIVPTLDHAGTAHMTMKHWVNMGRGIFCHTCGICSSATELLGNIMHERLKLGVTLIVIPNSLLAVTWKSSRETARRMASVMSFSRLRSTERNTMCSI